MRYIRSLMVGGVLLASVGAAVEAQAQGTLSNPNWAGPYVGVSIEGFSGQTNWSNPGGISGLPTNPASTDFSGALVGGLVGYRWQTGQIVYGLEGEYARGNVNSRIACPTPIFGLGANPTCQTGIQSRTKVTAQLGYSIGGFLPYAFAGYTLLEGKGTLSTFNAPIADGIGTHNGAVAGVGLDWAITPFTSFGISYQHAWYQSHTYDLVSNNCSGGSCQHYFSNVAIDPDSMMLNMKIRLNGTNGDDN